MNNSLLINATLDQPGLLENLVEKLAQRHCDTGYGKAVVPKSWKAVETSSTDTFVSGTIAMAGEDELINMPFITRFLFTCIKEKKDTYKLEWSFSLC
jgi:hypothetical protein